MLPSYTFSQYLKLVFAEEESPAEAALGDFLCTVSVAINDTADNIFGYDERNRPNDCTLLEEVNAYIMNSNRI